MWSKSPNWKNVTKLFTEFPKVGGINSFFVATGATILTIFLCTLAGYAFAKYNLKENKLLYLW